MAGDGIYGKVQPERGDSVVVGKRDVARRNHLAGRACNPRAGGLSDRDDATHMVGVVVGDEDVGQGPVRILLEPGEHRCRVTGVDHGAGSGRKVL